jgi:hypothetical protein
VKGKEEEEDDWRGRRRRGSRFIQSKAIKEVDPGREEEDGEEDGV